MSKKEEVREQKIKQPKMIQASTVLPWMLLAILTSLVVGLVLGWFLNVHMVADARVQAAAVAQSK